MKTYLSAPQAAVDEVEATLAKHLNNAAKALHADHAFIRFVEGELGDPRSVQFLSPRRNLWINDKNIRVVVLPEGRGLTRLAVEKDSVVTWPAAETNDIYEKADDGVTSEIVGTIHFRGRITGVALFDRTISTSFTNKDAKKLAPFLKLIDGAFEEHERTVKNALQKLAEQCCQKTNSSRGYIAVRRWGQLLEYFRAGVSADKFLKLSAGEGFAGTVFISGDTETAKKDVLEEQSYVTSDPNVQSQIACPIKDGADVIGVINLESYQRSAYGEKVKCQIEEFAREAYPWAAKFRQVDSYGIGLAAVALEDACTTYVDSCRHQVPSDGEAEQRLRTLLKDQIEQLPDVVNPAVFGRDQTTPPASAVSADNEVIQADVLVEGEVVATARVEVPTMFASSTKEALTVLCSIVSGSVRRLSDHSRVAHYNLLLELLLQNLDTEVGLERAVMDLPRIFQSDQCTLFIKMQNIFVPKISTGEKLSVRGWPYGYSPDDENSLTLLAARKKVPIRISDVTDPEELAALRGRLELPPSSNWNPRVSEDPETNARSFLAVPIFDPSAPHDKVTAILRTHRNSANRRPSFSWKDENAIKVIGHLLRWPVHAFRELASVSSNDE